MWEQFSDEQKLEFEDRFNCCGPDSTITSLTRLTSGSQCAGKALETLGGKKGEGREYGATLYL